jgi:hypothetical protein
MSLEVTSETDPEVEQLAAVTIDHLLQSKPPNRIPWSHTYIHVHSPDPPLPAYQCVMSLTPPFWLCQRVMSLEMSSECDPEVEQLAAVTIDELLQSIPPKQHTSSHTYIPLSPRDPRLSSYQRVMSLIPPLPCLQRVMSLEVSSEADPEVEQLAAVTIDELLQSRFKPGKLAAITL